MRYLGDFNASVTLGSKFPTHKADGTPITLLGSPVVSVYKRGSNVESTAGVTLTVDYDGRTGLNDVVIDTAADTAFYTAGSEFVAVITTGTVDGISVAGTPVFDFSIEARNIKANLVQQNGVAVLNYQLSIDTSVANTTVTLGTYNGGGSIPNDGRYAYCALDVVDGTGIGQLVDLTTATGTALQYNVVSGTMPVALNNTSRCNVVQSLRANATLVGVTVTTNNDKSGYVLDTAIWPAGFLAATFPTVVASTTNITSAALGATERQAIADAYLDRADAIETGVTPRLLMKRQGSALAGKVTGAGTGTEVFYAMANPSTVRITYTIDSNGNRTNVAFS